MINLKSKQKDVIPNGLYCRISEVSFISLPEAFKKYEAEKLSTPNALFITLIICFYEYCNDKYVTIGI